MKYILILLFTVSLSFKSMAAEEPDFFPISKVTRKQSSEPSKIKKAFLAETGLVEGSYALTGTINEECQDGDVEVVDSDNGVDIILGARTFVVGLGKDKTQENIYPDCKLTIKSSYKGSTIDEVREEICKKEKHTIRTNALIEKDKISYVRKVFLDEKLLKEISCSLKLVK